MMQMAFAAALALAMEHGSIVLLLAGAVWWLALGG